MSGRQDTRIVALEARLLAAVERRRAQTRSFEGQCEVFAAA
eukprot:gene632-46261_t